LGRGLDSPRRVVFFGLFGQRNWGNECTLQATIENVRKRLPYAELSCVCSGPEDASARYGIPTFPIRETPRRRGAEGGAVRLLRKVFVMAPSELFQWVRAFRVLRGADLLIAPGTGMLTDYASRPFGLPYGMFKWSTVAKLRRCKVLFVSVGAGPIVHPLSRFFIKAALYLADYRCYRDGYSRQYIEGIGFRAGDDPVYPDLAFSLPKDMVSATGPSHGEEHVIGVGLKDYYGEYGMRSAGEADYREYIDKTGSFVFWLLRHGYRVRLLMGDGTYDVPVREDLMANLKGRGFTQGDGQIYDEPPSSVKQLLSQIQDTDLVVSPRFHNILLALMLGKPAISLAYHEKFAALMAEVGLGEYCQYLDRLDVSMLIEQFKRLERDAASLMQGVTEKAEEYRRALDRQYEFILNGVR
jgi:polysaccharide pyruvyl transferase WcaK-like protein